MKLLIYCATPSRLNFKIKEIMDFVTKEGNAPFHPFQAFPYERFEGGSIGREKTMEFCRRAISICDEVYLFGISKGTLDDINEGKRQQKPISEFVEKFDPEWRKYYDLFVLNPKYEEVILEVVGNK
jgi:hypothetical protein